MNLILVIALTAIWVISTPSNVNAQKLPNIQQNNLKLPGVIKIDGKSTEWGNEFQAYNHNTNVFYSIGNNNDKLYLIIQAKDPVIAKKIIGGGITFSINRADKRNSDENASITFPLFKGFTQSKIANHLNELSTIHSDSLNRKKLDSMINIVNKEISDNAKEIKIVGIKEVPDSLISVYNSEGIRAAILFDSKTALTYELSIPLKYLGLSVSSNKFTYNIMLNGLSYTFKSVVKKGPDGPATVTAVPRGLMNGSRSNYQFLNFPTDFWGEYLLAKKAE